jgi:integral membrane sensor domain MASE1
MMNKPKKSRHLGPLFRPALIVAAYLCVFMILDYFSQHFEVFRGVVAWYPPAGLTYALLLVFGLKFLPAVTIALFASAVFIYRMPQSPYLLFLWAFIISLMYGAAVAFLLKLIHFDWQLRKVRDAIFLVAAAVVVSALLALLSVSSSALSSEMPRSEVLRAIFHWWIGETVGVLTVTPFLLMYIMPGMKRFAEGQPLSLSSGRPFPRPTLSAIGQASSIAVTLYWVFGARVLDEFRPMYLITLPLIWIALQRGFKGVSAAILALNSGVVLALWLFRFEVAGLGGLELLMIVNCIVGLLMGAVVTERRRAESQREAVLVELQMQKAELETSNNELMTAEKALQSRVNELQRWHTVTVDREGRMLELKSEVNDLLKEAGRPVKYSG